MSAAPRSDIATRCGDEVRCPARRDPRQSQRLDQKIGGSSTTLAKPVLRGSPCRMARRRRRSRLAPEHDVTLVLAPVPSSWR
jgi:hypothetical protein